MLWHAGIAMARRRSVSSPGYAASGSPPIRISTVSFASNLSRRGGIQRPGDDWRRVAIRVCESLRRRLGEAVDEGELRGVGSERGSRRS